MKKTREKYTNRHKRLVIFEFLNSNENNSNSISKRLGLSVFFVERTINSFLNQKFKNNQKLKD